MKGGLGAGTGDRSGLWIGNVALLDRRLTIRMTAHIAPILFIAKPTKNLIKIQWIFSDLDRLMRVVLTLHRILYMHIYNSNTIYLYRVASCHTLSDCSMPLFPFPFSVLRATTHWPSVCFGFGLFAARSCAI